MQVGLVCVSSRLRLPTAGRVCRCGLLASIDTDAALLWRDVMCYLLRDGMGCCLFVNDCGTFVERLWNEATFVAECDVSTPGAMAPSVASRRVFVCCLRMRPTGLANI